MVHLLSSARDSLLPVTSGRATLHHALPFPFVPASTCRTRTTHTHESPSDLGTGRLTPGTLESCMGAEVHGNVFFFSPLLLPVLPGTEIETTLVKGTNVIHCGTKGDDGCQICQILLQRCKRLQNNGAAGHERVFLFLAC